MGSMEDARGTDTTRSDETESGSVIVAPLEAEGATNGARMRVVAWSRMHCRRLTRADERETPSAHPGDVGKEEKAGDIGALEVFHDEDHRIGRLFLKESEGNLADRVFVRACRGESIRERRVFEAHVRTRNGDAREKMADGAETRRRTLRDANDGRALRLCVCHRGVEQIGFPCLDDETAIASRERTRNATLEARDRG